MKKLVLWVGFAFLGLSNASAETFPAGYCAFKTCAGGNFGFFFVSTKKKNINDLRVTYSQDDEAPMKELALLKNVRVSQGNPTSTSVQYSMKNRVLLKTDLGVTTDESPFNAEQKWCLGELTLSSKLGIENPESEQALSLSKRTVYCVCD